MTELINKMIDGAKSISNLGMISPDTPLKKQIEAAIKPKVKLTKKQRPKIIIVENPTELTQKQLDRIERIRAKKTVKKPQ